MKLGRLGIWTAHLDFLPASRLRDAAIEIEKLGFDAIWIGENVGREPFSQSAVLLAASDRLTVATGVINIWARDALVTAAGQLTLAEAFPDRFLLGLGVSHRHLVENIRGGSYTQPLGAMRDYLFDIDRFSARYRAVKPRTAPRVLAALGPRMLGLASELTDGAHTYLVPPEHTVIARRILGRDKLLAVEQAVVLETDAPKAREIGRAHVRRYLPLPNYVRNLRRLGYDDNDFAQEGSDRLVDAVVAWGDPAAVAERIAQHWSAGADHVCIQALPSDPRGLPVEQWRQLADCIVSTKAPEPN